MTTTTTRMRIDFSALTALFVNRAVLAGLIFGALLGLWGFHLTAGTFGSDLLLSTVGAFWGLVGGVIYVAFLQDLDLSSPAEAWFEDEPMDLEFEAVTEAVSEPAPETPAPAPAAAPVVPRRRAPATSATQ